MKNKDEICYPAFNVLPKYLAVVLTGIFLSMDHAFEVVVFVVYLVMLMFLWLHLGSYL